MPNEMVAKSYPDLMKDYVKITAEEYYRNHLEDFSLQYAQQVNADLVVIPTHARSGLSSFFHTSIAEAVATHAFPPVLTYHLA